MRLFSYCIPVDDGAAPNPFFGVCTLNICKPVIRRVAKVGDWVIGVGSTNVLGKSYEGKIVYAMKVTQKMTMEEYSEYCKNYLPEKIPDISHSNYERRVGDSIYTFDNGKEHLLPSVHIEANVGTDTGGKHSLLSDHFYYFGDKAIDIPNEYKSIIKQGQGHKSNANDLIKEEFIFWLEDQNFILNHLYSNPQIIIEFIEYSGTLCASIRCESASKDEKFSSSRKNC
jgi:hypothetical protein